MTVLDLELLGRLSEQTPTPYFCVDLTTFARRLNMLRAALPEKSQLYYSAKANPSPELLRYADVLGCGLEVASPGELSAALAAASDAQLIVVGPAKTDRFLEQAVLAGATLVVESVNETVRLVGVCERLGVADVTTLVRLNVPGAKGSLRMSGYQFGNDFDATVRCVEIIDRSERLAFGGFHAYLASQILDHRAIVHNCEATLTFVEAVRDAIDLQPEVIDFGGGFGIPYSRTEADLDLSALGSELRRLHDDLGGKIRFAFESGRFLAGPAGVLVTTVVDTKVVDGQRYVLLDGGINTSGLFGGATFKRAPLVDVVRDGVVIDGGDPSNICGPLCTPMDRLATNVANAAVPGDLVVWRNMGAYGRTAAANDFLSFGQPGEVFVDGVEEPSAREASRNPFASSSDTVRRNGGNDDSNRSR